MCDEAVGRLRPVVVRGSNDHVHSRLDPHVSTTIAVSLLPAVEHLPQRNLYVQEHWKRKRRMVEMMMVMMVVRVVVVDVGKKNRDPNTPRDIPVRYVVVVNAIHQKHLGYGRW